MENKSNFSMRSWSRVRTSEFGSTLPHIMRRDCISDLTLGSAHSTAELQCHHLMIKVCVSCVCDPNFSCEHVSTNGNGREKKNLCSLPLTSDECHSKLCLRSLCARLHHIEFLLDAIFYPAQNKLVYLLKIWPSLTAWRIRLCLCAPTVPTQFSQTNDETMSTTTNNPNSHSFSCSFKKLFSLLRLPHTHTHTYTHTHIVHTLASRHDWSASLHNNFRFFARPTHRLFSQNVSLNRSHAECWWEWNDDVSEHLRPG